MGMIKLLQGNEACAEGALYAGCTFFAGYPITPSTEVAEYLARRLPQIDGVFLQMEDEIAAMAAVIGGSLAGCKSLTATSGPGFSLKQENMGFAMLTEVPCVIVNVMRGGPSTGVPTGPGQSDIMQCRWGTHGDHPVICLTPAYVQEIFSETVRAFNLSEKYRTPVIIAFDEIVGHMRERIEIPDKGVLPVVNRVKPTCPPSEYLPYDDSKGDVPPMANFFEGYRYHVTGLNHGTDGFPVNASPRIHTDELRLMRKVEANKAEIIKYEEYMLEDAEVGDLRLRRLRPVRENGGRDGPGGRDQGRAVPAADHLAVPGGAGREPFQTRQGDRRPRALPGPDHFRGGPVREGALQVEGIYRVDGDPINPAQILAKVKEVR